MKKAFQIAGWLLLLGGIVLLLITVINPPTDMIQWINNINVAEILLVTGVLLLIISLLKK